MRSFGIPFRILGLPVAFSLALSACVAPVATTPADPAAAKRSAPVEPAEVAYVARMDGAIPVPAVPLDKLPEAYRRQEVAYQTDRPAGSIIIHPGQKFLYFVTGPNKAIRYGISVGKSGFEWAGEAVVSQTKNWPTWTPPPEMIERSPKLEKWKDGQPGGPTNPLGARAIYLLSNGRDYGYRIHGTPDWWSIGKNASSGCIRMIQQDVIDLNQRVQPGANVLVLNADGSMPKGLKIPTPPKPKKVVAKAKPKPAVPELEIKTVTYQPKPMAEAATAPTTDAATTAKATTTTPMVTTPAQPSQSTTTTSPVILLPENKTTP
ncbi:L,D-transpeptidase [Pseudorhodobacter sp. E13]|uniref:L,D-transpeptidase n=1 Tax=Pseudorhodobacter sp. E13 TaxID=2487931 RepID=UPI000F8F5938|nr:L,D-transpeptidase [Pseudorhodobacter sp. E13]RUS59167.1 L,D-transpeptidase [Pseudorhodobacter sp. E13]